MPTVLHVLPHAGGGAETYLELLRGLPAYEQRRAEVSRARSPLSAAPSILRQWPGIARRAHAADLVHVHGDAAGLITLPFLGRQPTVWTTHGLHLLRRRPELRAGVRRLIRTTRVTICTSQAEADELSVLAPALRERLAVVPNGIPLPPATSAEERAAIRSELGLAGSDVATLFLGQLEDRKRPLDAVAAALAVRSQGVPIRLLVVGDGPLAAAVAEHAGETVTPLGYRDDPRRLMQAVDVFILPSAREGLSFALLEAMAHGLAVVATDAPGIAEAISDAGVIVPAGDVLGLASALTRVGGDSELRSTLGRAARERVASEFSVQRLLGGVSAGYERALKGGAE